MTGATSPVFFKVLRGTESAPHRIGSEKALFVPLPQKFFYS
jgi:hypothetical protein